MEFETCVFEADCMFPDKPCAEVGNSSINASTIAGASLGFVGTLLKLPDVNVVSSAASTETILMVITVAEAGAAFSLADISTVFEVYPELLAVNFNNTT